MKQQIVTQLEKRIADEYSNTTGIVVLKNGEQVYSNYFNGTTANDTIHVFSVTKSIFSALLGIAIGQGYIQNVHQKVLGFFPQYIPPIGETAMQEVTIEHLLTMTAPFKYTQEPYEAFFTSKDWLRFALDTLGGEKPAAEFQYSAIIGPHILSGILAQATGQPILGFATQNLFAPLGIAARQNVVLPSAEEQMAWYANTTHPASWVADEQGLNTASWGLTLTPIEMAKMGQLYLNGGAWAGKPIVPASWVAQSTQGHSCWQQMHLPYGYLWWVLNKNRRIYAAMGDGGNIIYCNEEKQLVVAMAALFMPGAKDRIGLIRENIEPYM
ncbi:beta-lactamase family protein [Ruminococcaceae bacterium OttesenSCG-928-A16]|nr:beta-lactamase family protein [Ruminococcaceae bacterium OttesenSCG-928-A16]